MAGDVKFCNNCFTPITDELNEAKCGGICDRVKFIYPVLAPKESHYPQAFSGSARYVFVTFNK